MRSLFLVSVAGLTAIAIMAAIGCDSDKTLDPISPTMSFKDFPHTVGNWWRYEVVETDLNYRGEVRYDTVVITIVDSGAVLCDPTPCPEAFVERWERRSSQATDWMTVLYMDDQAVFEDPLYPHSLMFPLTLGSSWIGTRSTDTTEVIDAGIMTLESGMRVQYYVVRGGYTEANLTISRRITVSPGVGIVHMHLSHWAVLIWEGIEQEWTLLEWQVR